MQTIPTLEPTAARAGDTWRWRRDLPAYPAPLWVLTYTLLSPTGKIQITGTADSTSHLVTLTPTETAAFAAGRYEWVCHISDGVDRYQLDSGAIRVLPDVSAATFYDGRSHARKMLDAINALLENRASSGQIDLVKTSHGDKSIDRDLPTLLKMRQQYAHAVVAEDQAAAIARGEHSGRFIQVRFR